MSEFKWDDGGNFVVGTGFNWLLVILGMGSKHNGVFSLLNLRF